VVVPDRLDRESAIRPGRQPIANQAVGKPEARINGQQVANWPP
jgi:hypothetical protein